MTELQKVKILIGDVAEGDDELLSLLIEQAGDVINGLSRTPEDYKYLKLEAVIVAYNQRGAEGTKSGGSGGFSSSWAYETMSTFLKNNMPASYRIK